MGTYCPISILPNFSKIYEKNQNDILDSAQFGFRKKNSTSTTVSNTLQFINEILDNFSVVLSIFLNFSKAIDCEDHKILLKNRRSYGVRGIALSWFWLYLSNREQYVSINDDISERRLIDCDVPQGWISGPLLFLNFISDFPYSSRFFKFTLFADDVTLTCSFENAPTDRWAYIINKELFLIIKWL